LEKEIPDFSTGRQNVSRTVGRAAAASAMSEVFSRGGIGEKQEAIFETCDTCLASRGKKGVKKQVFVACRLAKLISGEASTRVPQGWISRII